MDDRLALVKGCIQHHWNTSKVGKRADEKIKEGIAFPRYGLQSARAVDVSNRRNSIAHVLAHVLDLRHERNIIVHLEPLGRRFAQYGGGKGAKRLAPFDFLVDHRFHIRPGGVGEEASLSHCPGPPLPAAPK